MFVVRLGEEGIDGTGAGPRIIAKANTPVMAARRAADVIRVEGMRLVARGSGPSSAIIETKVTEEGKLPLLAVMTLLPVDGSEASSFDSDLFLRTLSENCLGPRGYRDGEVPPTE